MHMYTNTICIYIIIVTDLSLFNFSPLVYSISHNSICNSSLPRQNLNLKFCLEDFFFFSNYCIDLGNQYSKIRKKDKHFYWV